MNRMISMYLFLFLVIVISIFSLNQQAWIDYDTNNERLLSSSKTNIDDALLQIASKSGLSTTEKIYTIVQVQASVKDDIKEYCEASALINWQRFIDQYSNKINGCIKQKERLNQLLGNIGYMTEYLKSDQELAAIITAANKKSSQNNQPGKWKLEEAIWRQAAIDVSKLIVTDQFKDIKTLANSSLTKVANAWKKLSSANDSKNRQQFEDACSDLDKAYATLTKISNKSVTEVKKLTTDLNSSYKKIY